LVEGRSIALSLGGYSQSGGARTAMDKEQDKLDKLSRLSWLTMTKGQDDWRTWVGQI
jgi:hypothetical protein